MPRTHTQVVGAGGHGCLKEEKKEGMNPHQCRGQVIMIGVIRRHPSWTTNQWRAPRRAHPLFSAPGVEQHFITMERAQGWKRVCGVIRYSRHAHLLILP